MKFVAPGNFLHHVVWPFVFFPHSPGVSDQVHGRGDGEMGLSKQQYFFIQVVRLSEVELVYKC